MRGRPPRKDLVRREVLERAADLFAARGVAGTTLQDIAAALAMTRSALYYYFPNKEALLTALVEDVTVTAANTVGAYRKARGMSHTERLRAAVRDRVTSLLERVKLARLLHKSDSELPPSIAEKHEAAKRRVLSEYTAMIAEGVAAGEFDPCNEKLSAFAIIGMSNWTVWWFSPEGDSPAHEVATTISNLAVRLVRRADRNGAQHTGLRGAVEMLREDLDQLERLLPK